VDARRAQKLGTTIEGQTKSRLNATKARGIHARIRQVLGKKERTSISIVEYTNDSNQIVQCLTQAEIEQACQQEGQRRFSQTEGTPFLTGSLLRDRGYTATQHTVDQILTGTYQCDVDVDYFTQRFIAELSMPEKVKAPPIISGKCSTLEHVDGWQRMKPTIASSSFGPLFTDYIAGTNHKKVADIDAAFASIPTLTGFSPMLWKKAIDVMIPKKKTSHHVHELRIIVLFHALFNMMNKRVGREMVYRANQMGLLPSEAQQSSLE